MSLPVTPPYHVEPPRLFSVDLRDARRGLIPAMCSLIVRRDALLALGGMEADFRGLYEDQVLYIKPGLSLRAVIDPRPSRCIASTPTSACELVDRQRHVERIGPSAPAAALHGVDGGLRRRRRGTRLVVSGDRAPQHRPRWLVGGTTCAATAGSRLRPGGPGTGPPLWRAGCVRDAAPSRGRSVLAAGASNSSAPLRRR